MEYAMSIIGIDSFKIKLSLQVGSGHTRSERFKNYVYSWPLPVSQHNDLHVFLRELMLLRPICQDLLGETTLGEQYALVKCESRNGSIRNLFTSVVKSWRDCSIRIRYSCHHQQDRQIDDGSRILAKKIKYDCKTHFQATFDLIFIEL